MTQAVVSVTRRLASAPERPARHPFEPVIEQRRAHGFRPPFRIVAFNARGGMRFDGIVACLKRAPLRDASVILVCEADMGLSRSGKRRVAFDLAAKLGMSCAYIGEYGLEDSHGEIRGYLGNAILSAEPLREVRVIALPRPRGSRPPFPRQFKGYRRVGGPAGLVATAAFGAATVRLCVAHLDSRCDPAGRERQMKALLRELPEGPMVLGGDLNTTTTELATSKGVIATTAGMLLNPRPFRSPKRYEPLFRRLEEAKFRTDGANVEGAPTFTFTRFIPPLFRPKLDWIALRELWPVRGSAMVIPARPSFIAARVSDHDFIVADVEL